MLVFQRPEVEPGLREELLRDEEDNKMICVSVQDDFVLKQDICVMCGSLGNDLEGRLIACTQCGQCYHPHCVNIRVSKIDLGKNKTFYNISANSNQLIFIFFLFIGNRCHFTKRLALPRLHGM